jgi:hypothetical protein
MLGGVAPQPRFQAPCNHILYDARCQVSAAHSRDDLDAVIAAFKEVGRLVGLLR